MCSRYSFVPDSIAWADYRAMLGALAEELLALAAAPRIAPTDRVPIVVRQPGEPPRILHARWGLIPHWWSKPELPKSTFNARSEGAESKPVWRDALAVSRCLIPATTWFEWQHVQGPTATGRKPAVQKIPHALRTDDGLGFMFAGLWSLWRARPDAEPMATCAMLTTEPAESIRSVHDRMPVVLAPAAWDAWLDPAMTNRARALEILREHTVRSVTAVTVR